MLKELLAEVGLAQDLFTKVRAQDSLDVNIDTGMNLGIGITTDINTHIDVVI